MALGPDMQRRATNTSRVREWFLSHPWQWVDTRTLELLGGRNAWRTRVSECRVKMMTDGLGTIKNRQRRDAEGVVFSEYRYEPLIVIQQGDPEARRQVDRIIDVPGQLLGRLF